MHIPLELANQIDRLAQQSTDELLNTLKSFPQYGRKNPQFIRKQKLAYCMSVAGDLCCDCSGALLKRLNDYPLFLIEYGGFGAGPGTGFGQRHQLFPFERGHFV